MHSERALPFDFTARDAKGFYMKKVSIPSISTLSLLARIAPLTLPTFATFLPRSPFCPTASHNCDIYLSVSEYAECIFARETSDGVHRIRARLAQYAERLLFPFICSRARIVSTRRLYSIFGYKRSGIYRARFKTYLRVT